MIYRAKHILTMAGEPVTGGEVLVRDGRIMAVGEGLSAGHPEEFVEDLGNCALVPGFVNAHSHIALAFSRCRFDALNLWDWMGALGLGPGNDVDEDLLRLSALVGAAECLLSGITSLGDCWPTGVGAAAMNTLGLRGVAYLEVFGQSAGSAYRERYSRLLDDVRSLQDQVDGRIGIGISPHSVYTSSNEMLALVAEQSQVSGVPVSIHVAETEAETAYTMDGTGPIADRRRSLGREPMVSGVRPLEVLRRTGLLRKGVSLAHCVHLSRREIELIAESGAGVAHCPRSNCYLGAGIAPVREMTDCGAKVGIGTDSSGSCLRMDFFEELRFAMGIQRAAAKDAAAVTAKVALELGTAGGAEALGLASEIGTIEPGRRADMIAVDLSRALPGEDLWLSVLAAAPSDVRLVLVDGVERVRDGRLSAGSMEGYTSELMDRMRRQGIG